MYPKKTVKKTAVKKTAVKKTPDPDFKTVITVPVTCATLVTTGGTLAGGKDIVKVEKLDGFANCHGFVRITVQKHYGAELSFDADDPDEEISFVVSASDLANTCWDIKNDDI